MRVLDVGCGVGGPAREIARFSDATIVGVNNNDFQIQRATQKTARAGLSHRVSFAKGDFMKLSEQFGENSFDASKSSLPKGPADFSLCHRGYLSRSHVRRHLLRDLQVLETWGNRESGLKCYVLTPVWCL